MAIGKMHQVHGDVKPEILIEIGFREFMMIRDNRFYAWQKYTDGLEIRQFLLDQEDVQASLLMEFVDTLEPPVGRHTRPTILTYEYFVTFIRKENLLRNQDFHEQYVIVLLHGEQLFILPFDSFNETGGDPLYRWPALALLDVEAGKLYGHGMRMGDFMVPLPVKDII